MKYNGPVSGDVRISGVINDVEFSAAGEASGDAATGEYRVELRYAGIPKDWHPFMYTDVKVSLLFLREEENGKNFHTLADGIYTSAGTIDLGGGNVLRNNTVIRMVDANTFTAVYVMYGTARMDELVSMEYFEETMLPWGPGRVAALGIAQWKTQQGDSVDALFSTRYHFDPQYRLDRPQVRRIEAKPALNGTTFSSTYRAFVRPLPRIIEEGGPYIGNLIA